MPDPGAAGYTITSSKVTSAKPCRALAGTAVVDAVIRSCVATQDGRDTKIGSAPGGIVKGPAAHPGTVVAPVFVVPDTVVMTFVLSN